MDQVKCNQSGVQRSLEERSTATDIILPKLHLRIDMNDQSAKWAAFVRQTRLQEEELGVLLPSSLNRYDISGRALQRSLKPRVHVDEDDKTMVAGIPKRIDLGSTGSLL